MTTTIKLTPATLRAMREVAERATQGEWQEQPSYYNGFHGVVIPHGDGGRYIISQEEDTRNTRHIATFDPPAALALLDEIERLRRAVTDLLAAGDSLCNAYLAVDGKAIEAAAGKEGFEVINDGHADWEDAKEQHKDAVPNPFAQLGLEFRKQEAE